MTKEKTNLKNIAVLYYNDKKNGTKEIIFFIKNLPRFISIKKLKKIMDYAGFHLNDDDPNEIVIGLQNVDSKTIESWEQGKEVLIDYKGMKKCKKEYRIQKRKTKKFLRNYDNINNVYANLAE